MLTAEQIRQAFPSPIEPVRTPWRYRLALLGLLFTLLFLQAIYVTLVLSAAAATIIYILILPVILTAVMVNWLTIGLILAPPVVGAIVTFFLFKPFLIPRPQPVRGFAIQPKEQPELFAFVEALCRCVGAPPPTAIDVDLAVNASAGFHRGWRSLFTNDLRLTIGLPLAQGLTLRQFTGVLAHEFGHFAQTAGLRSWFLIQNIQIWFHRVAHERDRWDDKLDNWRENGVDWRLRIVFHLANASVEASRGILRLLLRLANLVSCHFSRQMEFDADHYEAQIAGAQTFHETTLALPVLGAAAAVSWRKVEVGLATERIANSFPSLVQMHVQAFPSDALAAFHTQTLAEEAERYATHPSPADRIANVRRSNPAGIFTLEGPASELFRDFEGLCRRTTLESYRASLAGGLLAVEIVPTDQFVADVEYEQELSVIRESLLPQAHWPHSWLHFESTPPLPDHAFEDDQDFGNLLTRLLHHEGGVALLEAGARINPPSFYLHESNLPAAAAQRDDTLVQLQRTASQLRSGVHELIRQVREQNHPSLADYQRYTAVQPGLLDLRVQLTRLEILQANQEHVPAHAMANALEAHRARLTALTETILSRLEATGTLGIRLRSIPGAPELRASYLSRQADTLGIRLLNRVLATSTTSVDPPSEARQKPTGS